MYFIKLQFISFVISLLVIAEERWYPANIAPLLMPNFIVPDELNTNKVTRNKIDFNLNTTSKHNTYKSNWSVTNNTDQSIILNSDWKRPNFNRFNEIPSVNGKNRISVDANDMEFKQTEANYLNINKIDFSNTIWKDLNDFARSELKRRIIGENGSKTRLNRLKTITTNATSKARFLDVFQVVEFEHVLCMSDSGLEGRCLHHYDCETVGGSPMGTCADGYGICCVIVFSCYDETSAAVGWFTNPEYPLPNTDRLSCALTVNKTSQDVKQIRLDFARFELLPPIGGTCEHDQFVVSGQSINNVIPILCGINTGQHLYIEVDDTEGPIRLTIQTIAPESRLFSIKVTQLTRSDILAAPTGCLQYFNVPQGYIESFNYRNISEVNIAKRPSYLNNLNYAICIERESTSCSITYTNEDEMQIPNYDTDGLPIIPPRQAGVEIFNCPSDWLLVSASRLCGERFNDGSVLQDFYLDAPVTDIGAGPITIWFRSDEGYVGRGFKLQYQQNACPKSI